MDQTMTIVGVLFCLPTKPLRNGYRWTITQNAKKSFPKRGPHDSYPLLIALETPATTPMKFNRSRVVGGISKVVHLNVYSSENSSSSPPFDVTVKLVSTPAMTLRSPWNTAKRREDTPPMTQNCSFLHQSSMPTPLHLISRMLVAKMQIKSDMNQRLATLFSSGVINFPVSKQMAGNVQ
uniref:CESA5 n=1 Tax=Arundo donax TaxID=35708 RepID=A0A0A9F4W0_ARUDO